MKKAIFWVFVVLLALPQAGFANNPPADCDTNSYITPVVNVEVGNSQINMSWNKIDHSNLLGYKVVISKDDSTPVYPQNGYLRWITDTNITSYVVDNSTAYRNGDFGSYLENGENYYFSITAVYNCGGRQSSVAGNVVEATYPGNSQGDNSTDDDEYDDDTSNVALPTPEVTISSSEDGVLVSWKKIDDNRFNGYKVVASKSNSKPKYPEDGYLKYITDDDVTSYLINNSSAYRNGDFGNYFKADEEYYFSITALYSTGKVAGNVVSATYQGPAAETINKPDDKDPLVEMERKAEQLRNNELGDILSEMEQLRNRIREQENEIKYLRGLVNDLTVLNQEVRDSLNQFITYGVDQNTEQLGEGERAAVIYSFKSAYDKLPETDEELADAIRIANGRWPSQTSETAEVRARAEFKRIYLRDADMSNPNDNAAVTVMAYGLRQKASNRNLDSERQGIKTFQYIYGHAPQTTEEWNIMQAITYSGATR